MGKMVLGETMQTLPTVSAGHVSPAPLAPSSGAGFHPRDEKLGQVLLQGAAPAEGVFECSADTASSAAGFTGLAVRWPGCSQRASVPASPLYVGHPSSHQQPGADLHLLWGLLIRLHFFPSLAK